MLERFRTAYKIIWQTIDSNVDNWANYVWDLAANKFYLQNMNKAMKIMVNLLSYNAKTVKRITFCMKWVLQSLHCHHTTVLKLSTRR